MSTCFFDRKMTEAEIEDEMNREGKCQHGKKIVIEFFQDEGIWRKNLDHDAPYLRSPTPPFLELR